jgi:succinate dehydrogenase / fumarate reductase flavoprotein subunit
MLENFAVFREEAKMLRQREILLELRERFKNVYVEDKGEVFNSDLTSAIELGNMLDTALCMVEGGIWRKESRGAHSRPHDYPKRDDERFMVHTITRWRDGDVELSTEPVRVTKWEPEERKY